MGIRDQGNTDIWIWELARETLRRLTFAPGMDGMPVWTPDGRRIVFMSDRAGALNLYSQAADGDGTVARLTTSANPQWSTSLTSDGRYLFGFDLGPARAAGVIVVDLADAASHSLLHTVPAAKAAVGSGPSSSSSPSPSTLPVRSLFRGAFPEISPDGRYLAYQSDESGRDEVYVRSFRRGDDGLWQISTGGATRPAWARSGRELFYLDEAGALIAVPILTSGATLIVGAPTTLFDTKYVEANPARHYDVSPDGQRFVMLKDRGADPNATPASMIVVQHWTDELKQRVPTR
jgi:serine/threonine-protein kinase